MFCQVKIRHYGVTAEHRFALLSAAFSVVQMISSIFCLHVGLHPNLFENKTADLLARWRSAAYSSLESIWSHHGDSACPWRGGVVNIRKELYRLVSFFQGFTDILLALVACCVFIRGAPFHVKKESMLNFWGSSCWRKSKATPLHHFCSLFVLLLWFLCWTGPHDALVRLDLLFHPVVLSCCFHPTAAQLSKKKKDK